jgi:antitoxin ParD1/3/4
MSVSLPSKLKEHVKRRAEVEHYGTPSDYVRGLIRRDIKRHERKLLESMLLEGLGSGSASPMNSREWSKVRAQVRAKNKK